MMHTCGGYIPKPIKIDDEKLSIIGFIKIEEDEPNINIYRIKIPKETVPEDVIVNTDTKSSSNDDFFIIYGKDIIYFSKERIIFSSIPDYIESISYDTIWSTIENQSCRFELRNSLLPKHIRSHKHVEHVFQRLTEYSITDYDKLLEVTDEQWTNILTDCCRIECGLL